MRLPVLSPCETFLALRSIFTNGIWERYGCVNGMTARRFELPPLDLLPAFEAAARTLSFTRAAAELFLTQSAVSRQIKTLEERLGCVLFERRTRALRLTDAGQDLYRVTAEVLDRLRRTVARLHREPPPGMLTVTTTPGLASLWLIPRLQRLRALHPQIELRIAATNDVLDLERARIDVAIRYGIPQSQPPGAVSLFGEEAFPVCSPALIAAPSQRLETPSDLSRHVLLHLDYPSARGSWLDWETWLTALGVADLQPAGALHFTHYDQMIHAAMAGQGIALGRTPMIGQLIRDRKLVPPLARTAALPRAYFVVASALAAGKPQVQAFTAWLHAEVALDAGLDAAP